MIGMYPKVVGSWDYVSALDVSYFSWWHGKTVVSYTMFSNAKLDKFPGSGLLDLFNRGSSSAPNTPAHSSKSNNAAAAAPTANSKPTTPAHQYKLSKVGTHFPLHIYSSSNINNGGIALWRGIRRPEAAVAPDVRVNTNFILGFWCWEFYPLLGWERNSEQGIRYLTHCLADRDILLNLCCPLESEPWQVRKLFPMDVCLRFLQLYRWVSRDPNKQHQGKFFEIKQISNQACRIALWRLRCSF